MDLHDDDDDYWNLVGHDGWWYEVDDDGRITTLSIGDEEDLDPFDLPAGAVRLERLTCLDIYDCRSLPVNEVSKLPHLEELRLRGCSDIFGNFPAQMDLKYLKTFHLNDSQFQSSSPFLLWMVGQLPSLEIFEFLSMEKNETNCILDAIQNFDVCLQTNLKEFWMIQCKLNDNHLETILVEILPRFPNISYLDLGWNQIQSIQSIVDRLKSDKTCFLSKSISHLGLCNNPEINRIASKTTNHIAVHWNTTQFKVQRLRIFRIWGRRLCRSEFQIRTRRTTGKGGD